MDIINTDFEQLWDCLSNLKTGTQIDNWSKSMRFRTKFYTIKEVPDKTALILVKPDGVTEIKVRKTDLQRTLSNWLWYTTAGFRSEVREIDRKTSYTIPLLRYAETHL